MTHEEKFVSLLGTPTGAEQAYMLAIPANVGNPVRLLSRNLPSGGKVKIDGPTMYVKAEQFNHGDAVLLQVS